MIQGYCHFGRFITRDTRLVIVISVGLLPVIQGYCHLGIGPMSLSALINKAYFGRFMSCDK